jgi:hypothetical protein
LNPAEKVQKKYQNVNFKIEAILLFDEKKTLKNFKERDYFIKFFISYCEYVNALKSNNFVNLYPVCPKCKNAYVKING